MADEVMRGSNELLALRPEIWSASFYDTLLETLPMNEVIARDFEGEIQALGDTVNISSFPQFDEAEEILEDEKTDADAVTAVKTPLVIDKQVVKDYIITSRAQVQTIEASDALRNLAFHAIMKKMQRILFDATLPVAGNQLSYTAATTLDLPDILAGKERLDVGNVPQANRCLVTDAPQWNDLFNVTGFTSSDFISSRPNESGLPPVQIFGFTPKMTTEANAITYMFHPQYQEMAVQRSLQVEVFNRGGEGNRSFRVNSTILFGTVQMDGNRVVTIS